MNITLLIFSSILGAKMSDIRVEYKHEYFKINDILAEKITLTKIYYKRDGQDRYTSKRADADSINMDKDMFSRLYQRGVINNI